MGVVATSFSNTCLAIHAAGVVIKEGLCEGLKDLRESAAAVECGDGAPGDADGKEIDRLLKDCEVE